MMIGLTATTRAAVQEAKALEQARAALAKQIAMAGRP
jgi:hypothetical protein